MRAGRRHRIPVYRKGVAVIHNAAITAIVTYASEGRRRRIRLAGLSTMEQVSVAMLRRGIHLFKVRFLSFDRRIPT